MNKKFGNFDKDPVFTSFMERISGVSVSESQGVHSQAVSQAEWGGKSIVEVTEELLRQLNK